MYVKYEKNCVIIQEGRKQVEQIRNRHNLLPGFHAPSQRERCSRNNGTLNADERPWSCMTIGIPPNFYMKNFSYPYD